MSTCFWWVSWTGQQPCAHAMTLLTYLFQGPCCHQQGLRCGASSTAEQNAAGLWCCATSWAERLCCAKECGICSRAIPLTVSTASCQLSCLMYVSVAAYAAVNVSPTVLAHSVQHYQLSQTLLRLAIKCLLLCVCWDCKVPSVACDRLPVESSMNAYK